MPETADNADAAVVDLDHVTFRYDDPPGQAPVIEDVSLRIGQRDFLGLIGPNGGGKTTLLKVILGLVRPQSGTVRVLGTSPRAVRRFIGYVPQHPMMDASVPATVQDLVLMGRLGASAWGFRYHAADIDRARHAMAEVGVADLAQRRPAELSGGQRQRVLISRALCADTRLLLLDEPTAGVDLHMEQGIMELLERLSERMPVVLVSHDVAYVSTYVRRVACLNRRMVVHPADQVTDDLIHQMYQNGGPMQPVRHRHNCPNREETTDEDGDDQQEPRS